MRRLSAVERSAYDHVPAPVAARVRVQRVPLLPPGADAMTLGPLVLVRRDEMRHRTGRRELLAHELVHARQWAELGVGRFLGRYLWAYGANLRLLRRHRDAYLAIPLEEEARAEAARWAARRPARD
ncbi:MAG TPA: DUF4157 domain-containing protein [Acidimicrobiales bacterium]|nr:DUF4157 domain-containing protein [Acidimicrobiales bacterium]